MTSSTRSRVVVGVDESLAGLRALRSAVAEARRRQATLIAARIWSVQIIWPHSPVGYLPHEHVERQAVELVHRAFVSAMVELPLDVDLKVVTTAGAAGPELVRLADRDDDLLVVGSGQRTLFNRMFHGSTATFCVAHADCPVLVVPRHALAKAGTPRALSRQLRREVRKLVEAA